MTVEEEQSWIQTRMNELLGSDFDPKDLNSVCLQEGTRIPIDELFSDSEFNNPDDNNKRKRASTPPPSATPISVSSTTPFSTHGNWSPPPYSPFSPFSPPSPPTPPLQDNRRRYCLPSPMTNLTPFDGDEHGTFLPKPTENRISVNYLLN
jgi:hypothetical protein